ncbi:MAG: sensor histidine kinase [Rhodobacteraceae bacterium]|nr:sensor histidine kinase [Paracoccaceae bacterium]
MTLSFNLLVAVCVAYVAALFLLAFAAERLAAQGRGGWLRSPLVYTLSLSIYCTAWTFYGAVGYAARSGLEFITIYLGPTLVMTGWWLLLRKLVRIGKAQRITSVADLLAARYGKSVLIGAIVTLMAVIAGTPYIALQLQSVTLALSVFAEGAAAGTGWDERETALLVAAGLALFTILFGTRNLDADERHHGVVVAIAVEAVVKLVALLAVGVFVVWGVSGGVAEMFARIEASPIAEWDLDPGRWVALTFLSGAALLCLPRMFQVLVVENVDDRQLAAASWAFPLYLFLISLFVVPIAVAGLERFGTGANSDLFVLTLPLSEGQGGLAMLAFLGGFSAATSMVIVEAIALATMVSNHIVLPIWLSIREPRAKLSEDVRVIVLRSRRVSIAAILALGWIYYRVSGGGAALAAIGLISFVGVAQFLPAMIGGLFWRGATRTGAAAGLVTGFAIWAYTYFLPSFGAQTPLWAEVQTVGPYGLAWLRPQALFGIEGINPLVHAVFWSISLNTLVFVAVSLLTFPGPVERLQGVEFVGVFDREGSAMRGWRGGAAGAEELLVMSQHILGPGPAQRLFQEEAAAQGTGGFLPEVTAEFLERLERRLAGAVGSATAHAMIAQAGGGTSITVDDLMAVADEAQQIMEYSQRLEAQSEELSRTARQLREANRKLTELSVQKDAFLSQISHELRTPMTSIRAFSEILGEEGLSDEDRRRYARVIQDEAVRLTRLLDDLLDLSVLESGTLQLDLRPANLADIISRAVATAGAAPGSRPFRVIRDREGEDVTLVTDPDRLAQVFINLLTNARKYCDAERQEVRIEVGRSDGGIQIDVIDNGSGIPRESQEIIFEKFARLGDHTRAGGAGLGLAICREIVEKLGGAIAYLPGQGGAAFRITLPGGLARAA